MPTGGEADILFYYAAIAVAAGLVECFFGYRIFRFILGVAGVRRGGRVLRQPRLRALRRERARLDNRGPRGRRPRRVSLLLPLHHRRLFPRGYTRLHDSYVRLQPHEHGRHPGRPVRRGNNLGRARGRLPEADADNRDCLRRLVRRRHGRGVYPVQELLPARPGLFWGISKRTSSTGWR